MSDYPDCGAGQSGPSDDAAGLWPPGDYIGRYVRHTCLPSALQGTPGIQIHFDVAGTGQEAQVDCWITEATLASLTGEQLAAIGWNGRYGPECSFGPPESVKLYVRHETYKNKLRERWAISTIREASATTSQAANRACQLWRARRAAPTPVPATRPQAPPPARPAPPIQPAPPNPEPIASTMDAAWSAWVAAGREKADEFWTAIEAVRPGGTAETLTADEWARVAQLATDETPF